MTSNKDALEVFGWGKIGDYYDANLYDAKSYDKGWEDCKKAIRAALQCQSGPARPVDVEAMKKCFFKAQKYEYPEMYSQEELEEQLKINERLIAYNQAIDDMKAQGHFHQSFPVDGTKWNISGKDDYDAAPDDWKTLPELIAIAKAHAKLTRPPQADEEG